MAKRKPESLASKLHRKSETRIPYEGIYIYCNGITERDYFLALRRHLGIPTIMVSVTSSNSNRLSLVEELETQFRRQRDICTREHTAFKQYKDYKKYVVFDVDSLPKGKRTQNPGDIRSQADNAVHKCNALGYTAIVSNECFELWFVLHYQYINIEFHRDALCDMLGTLTEKAYQKNKTPLFPVLLQHIQNAIANAKALADSHPPHKPVSQCRPYTNVHELVNKLFTMKKKSSVAL